MVWRVGVPTNIVKWGVSEGSGRFNERVAVSRRDPLAERLVGFQPIVTDAALGDEGHGEVDSVLHGTDNYLADLIDLVNRDVEVQFVMHLHDHLRLQVALLEFIMNGDHGNLDDIGSRTLNGCVHGVAFGKSADGTVMRNDVGQVTLAAEERFYT